MKWSLLFVKETFNEFVMNKIHSVKFILMHIKTRVSVQNNNH